MVRADAALLAGRDAVVVAGRSTAIVRRAGTDDKPILRLEGSSSREDADALRGEALQVPLEDAPPLEPGEFWARDLEGCLVTDGEREVGVVEKMVALPSCEALAVGALLIPMVRDAIRTVDLERRTIDVDMAFVGE